jgi:biotin carboxyl carrier protein
MNKREMKKTILAIPEESLNDAIKLAKEMFGYDPKSTNAALKSDVPKHKTNYLSVIPDDTETELVEDFFNRLNDEILSGAEEDEPEYEEDEEPEVKPTRRGAKVAAKPAARAAKPAPKQAARSAKPAAKTQHATRTASESVGKILIAGDPAKIAAKLSPRVEVAARGNTILAERTQFVVEAIPGKGVVIKDFVSGKLNHPMWFLRQKLSGTPFLKKALVFLDDMTEQRAERCGLTATRDGKGWHISE